MVAEPRALAERADDPVTLALAQLTCVVTEAPWKLTPRDFARARLVGLSDEAILQVVLLSSLFGHLNRVADAVGIDLDCGRPRQHGGPRPLRRPPSSTRPCSPWPMKSRALPGAWVPPRSRICELPACAMTRRTSMPSPPRRRARSFHESR